MWQAGAARQTINPEAGHGMGGYGPGYPNTGVHDDLSATALYLSDGTTDALLVVLDLIGMLSELEASIRAATAQATGLPAERIFLTCTHTHRGPEVRPLRYRSGPTPGVQPAYNQRLATWVATAGADARRAAAPCEWVFNWTQAHENLNRRVTFPDRRLLGIPENKQLSGMSPEYVDRELGLLAFRHAGTPNQYIALLTNYAAHPVCVGNTSNLISADYPGALRRTVEATFVGGLCLATTGATGDLHPLRPESGFAEAERMGTALASLALSRVYDAVPAPPGAGLRTARRSITLRLKDAASRARYPTENERNKESWITQQGRTELTTDYYLIALGPVLLVGVPGELAAELGAILKWSSPYPKTFILYQATDAADYFVPSSHYYWGGYTATSTLFAAGEAERMIQAILETARELAAG